MREILARNIAWRRNGVQRDYVGTLVAAGGGILLAGRDPSNGLEVSLSIPLTEVEDVHVAETGGAHEPKRIVLQLVESEPISLCELGGKEGHLLALARRLDALAHAPTHAQGG
jgi:hypothetical protein